MNKNVKYLSHLLFIVLCLVGCSDREYTINFIFPDGFSGLALISKDETSGRTLSASNSVYTIEIPENGRLVVRSFFPINQWHKETARYKSGEFIPAQTYGYEFTNALYALPFVQNEGCYYFVGTKADYDQISKRPDFHELPLATKIELDTNSNAQLPNK